MCIRDRAYRKAGYSKKFREEHEEEILLHQAAKNAFDEMGVKKLPKVKELQTEYAKLLEEKKKTYVKYRRSREEMRELLTAKACLLYTSYRQCPRPNAPASGGGKGPAG